MAAGAVLVVLGPDPDHALNAVSALGAVGTSKDEQLLKYVAGAEGGMPEVVQKQERREEGEES